MDAEHRLPAREARGCAARRYRRTRRITNFPANARTAPRVNPGFALVTDTFSIGTSDNRLIDLHRFAIGLAQELTTCIPGCYVAGRWLDTALHPVPPSACGLPR